MTFIRNTTIFIVILATTLFVTACGSGELLTASNDKTYQPRQSGDPGTVNDLFNAMGLGDPDNTLIVAKLSATDQYGGAVELQSAPAVVREIHAPSNNSAHSLVFEGGEAVDLADPIALAVFSLPTDTSFDAARIIMDLADTFTIDGVDYDVQAAAIPHAGFELSGHCAEGSHRLLEILIHLDLTFTGNGKVVVHRHPKDVEFICLADEGEVPGGGTGSGGEGGGEGSGTGSGSGGETGGGTGGELPYPYDPEL